MFYLYIMEMVKRMCKCIMEIVKTFVTKKVKSAVTYVNFIQIFFKFLTENTNADTHQTYVMLTYETCACCTVQFC